MSEMKTSIMIWGVVSIISTIIMFNDNQNIVPLVLGANFFVKSIAFVMCVILGTIGAIIASSIKKFVFSTGINQLSNNLYLTIFWHIGLQIIGVLFGMIIGALIILKPLSNKNKGEFLHSCHSHSMAVFFSKEDSENYCECLYEKYEDNGLLTEKGKKNAASLFSKLQSFKNETTLDPEESTIKDIVISCGKELKLESSINKLFPPNETIKPPLNSTSPQVNSTSSSAKENTIAPSETAETGNTPLPENTQTTNTQTPEQTKAPVSTENKPAEQKSANRYRINGDLVTDTKTGLMWMRCSLGQKWDGSTCQGDATTYTWKKAIDSANNFSFAGYSDWRLPTVQELKTLVYCSGGQPTEWNEAISSGEYDGCIVTYNSPTIVQEVFPNTPATWEWSSTPNDTDTNHAWAVNFGKGSAPRNGDKTGAVPVRLVRNESASTVSTSTVESENTSQTNVIEQTADSMQTEKTPTTPEEYIQKMLHDAMIDDSNSIQASRKYLETLPKPAKGDRNAARKINEEGLKFIQTKQYEQALPLFAKASKTDPSDVEALNNYGFALMMSNHLNEAETVLIKTLIMKPDRTAAWSNLGHTFAFQGKEEQAVDSYMNAYLFSKKPDKTVEFFKKQLAQEDNPHLKNALSRAIDQMLTDND